MDVTSIIKGFFQTNVSYLDELRTKKALSQLANISASDLYSVVHKQSEPIFVLSTGRTGTLLLTEIFNGCENTMVEHEPMPELVWHSAFAYSNSLENPNMVTNMFDAARYEFIRNSWIVGKRYVETNNRITFFARSIADIFPNAKFVHVVRNPFHFIKSGIKRNWYTGKHLHDEGRILNSNIDWKAISQPQKIAWLWNETNKWCESFKKDFPERSYFIKSEDLFRNSQEVLKMLDFLNLKGLKEKNISGKIKKPRNSSVSKSSGVTFNKEDVIPFLELCDLYGY